MDHGDGVVGVEELVGVEDLAGDVEHTKIISFHFMNESMNE